jgi:transposase-like protein
MAVMIAGQQFWLWRAVDDEREVLDLLVRRRRDKNAAVKLMRKLLKKQGFTPDVLVTDNLRSAKVALGLSASHQQGLRKNNRAENSRQPCDGASARCNASNRLDQRCASFPFTPPSTIPSTSNVISHLAAPFGSSGAKHYKQTWRAATAA